MPAHPFILRWQNSAAAERANYQIFLCELCDYLVVPRPDPAVSDDRQNRYVFERPVTFCHPGAPPAPDSSISTSGAASSWRPSKAAKRPQPSRTIR